MLLRGGGLVDNFEKISAHLICLEDKHRHPAEFKYSLMRSCETRPIRFAIVSSIASWDFILSSLGAAFVPTVTLIHEFASYMRPSGAMREALGWVSEPVFSSEITANSFRDDHPALLLRRVHVIPQGQCRLPSTPTTVDLAPEHRRVKAAMRPPGAEEDLLVLGAGAVQIRKGVDLFIASAAAAHVTRATDGYVSSG